MNEYSQLIDDIIALLNTESPDQEFATDLADRYQDACRSANLRLQECEGLLRKGHRTEAIQRATMEPDLLELVGILAFPELEFWLDFLLRVGFPAVPPLKIVIARELNRQMAEEQPLEKLLRKHRLLALGRAPLASRISVLRMIRDKDPNNTAWHSDILVLEKARGRELSSEIDKVTQAGDLIATDQLVLELESNEWSIPIPDEYRQRVRDLQSKLAIRDLHRQLEQIANGLSQAWNELDFESGRQYRDQWNQLYLEGNLPPESPIREMAEDALLWLDEEDNRVADEEAFESSVLLLEKTVADSDANRDRLLAAFRRASNFEQPLSDVLSVRFRERIAVLDLADRRKQRFRYISFAIILLLVAGVSGGIIHTQSKRSATRSAIAKAKAMFESGEHSELRNWHEELLEESASVATNEDFQKWVIKSKNAEQQYNDDLVEFEGEIKRAKGSGEPSQFDKEALDRAKALAEKLGPDERLRVVEMQAELNDYETTRDQQRTVEFKSQLEDLKEKIADLDTRSDVRVADVVTVQQELANFKQEFQDLPESTLKITDILATRLTEIKEISMRTEFFSLWHEETQEAIGNTDSFKSQLDLFVEKLPESVVSKDLQVVVEEERVWKGLISWSKFYTNAAFKQFEELNRQDALALKVEGKSLTERYGECPLASRFTDHLQHIEAVQIRESIDQQRLQEYLNEPVTTRYTYLVQLKDGTRYYTKEDDIDLSTDEVVVAALTGEGGTDKDQTLDRNDIEYYGENPLVLLANDIRKSLSSVEDGWDKTHQEAFQLAIAEEPMTRNRVTDDFVATKTEVDPLWRLNVIKYLVASGVEGKGLFGLLLQQLKINSDRLKEVADTGVDWIDPENKDTKVERSNASIFIVPLQKEYPLAIKDLGQIRTRLLSVADCRYLWIGFLKKSASGIEQPWQILLGSETGDKITGSLHVITRERIGTSFRYQVSIAEIGKAMDGMIELDEELKDGLLIAGRPIFLRLLPQGGGPEAEE